MNAAPRAVVVGSGIAGVLAALHAAAGGCRVTLVTKDAPGESNTRYAQGGIAGVLGDGDSAEAHARDTLAAGAGLGDPAAVHVLVTEGPGRIRELIDLGVAFDRATDGSLDLGLEAAHSRARIAHAGGDATGLAISRALVARLRESTVRVVSGAFLVDLVRDPEGRVRGVELLHADGSRELLDADAVVLATGGAGRLYAHTTNPAGATGDGIAAAIRAGAAVADLEFVQFHPTVLAVGAAFLVSEAVRGEGAVLVDDDGRRFVFDDHPDGELAPRDVVARSIARRMREQGGRPVLRDATALGAGFLATRFPTIDRAVRERGLDWARSPIPVTPAAHYLMGGIVTDLSGRTGVPGLYAVGEAARTGVHGANRLASNSLLEGAVFGPRVGDAIAADAASGTWPTAGQWPGAALGPFPAPGSGALPGTGRSAAHPPVSGKAPDLGRTEPADAVAAPPRFSRAALQELMWADAGLVRTAEGLDRAAAVIAGWRADAGAASERARTRTELRARTRAELEDANLLLVAEHVVAAARARPLSVGAHFRADEHPVAPPLAVDLETGLGTHDPARARVEAVAGC